MAEDKGSQSIAFGAPSLRSFVIGLACVAFLCWAAPWVDIYFRSSELAGSHFPLGPFLLLLFMAWGVDALVPRLHPWLRLRPAELTTIYCMTLAGAGIPTFGLVAYLLPAITATHYYSTSANEWVELVGANIPESLRPTDPEAIRQFYESLHGSGVPWSAWYGPLFTGLFLLLPYLRSCFS